MPGRRSQLSTVDPDSDLISHPTPVRLDPERAYIGALLWLPADSTGRMASLVGPEDLADVQLRVALQLVRELAAAGVPPDPVAVLAHARAAGTVTTQHATKALAELLADLYGSVPTAASVNYYAACVLDDSLRRRCAVAGERIAQAAERSSLAALVGTVGAEVVQVHQMVARRGQVLESLGLPIAEVA
jgi:replicative DNA helicase